MTPIHQQAGETLAVKTAAAVQTIGAVGAGTSAVAQYLGLTTDQWTIVGIIGGLAIAAVGLLARIALDWYFRRQHLDLARQKATAWSPLGDGE